MCSDVRGMYVVQRHILNHLFDKIPATHVPKHCSSTLVLPVHVFAVISAIY